MTRLYLSADERRQQALAVLRDGITITEIRDAMGYSKSENATRVMDVLVYAGQAFSARSKTHPDTGSKEWTTRYFLTAKARDEHVAAKDEAIAARRKARKQTTASRMPYYIKRNAERKAARAERMQAREAERRAQREAKERAAAEAKALRAAEAEQRKLRARLDREAAEAQKERDKAEAKKTKLRLKAETAQAGQLVFKKGTERPAAAKPKGPAFIDGEMDLSKAKITRAPDMPERWATAKVSSVVDSRECRAWAGAIAA